MMSNIYVFRFFSLLVTQDFFLDLGMPYSVKRGELAYVNVTVFNTVDR